MITSFICGSCTFLPEKGNKNSPPNFRFSMIRNIILLSARNERKREKKTGRRRLFRYCNLHRMCVVIDCFYIKKEEKPVNAVRHSFLFFNANNFEVTYFCVKFWTVVGTFHLDGSIQLSSSLKLRLVCQLAREFRHICAVLGGCYFSFSAAPRGKRTFE